MHLQSIRDERHSRWTVKNLLGMPHEKNGVLCFPDIDNREAKLYLLKARRWPNHQLVEISRQSWHLFQNLILRLQRNNFPLLRNQAGLKGLA